MPKFDHRFDNQIQRKEDLRFTRQDDAEDFAIAQFSTYGIPQMVFAWEDDEPVTFYGVKEVLQKYPHISSYDGLVNQEPDTALFFINSLPGE